MAKSFITLFLLFYGTLSFAQIESYPLADYFRPDLERRTANYSTNFSFNNRNDRDFNLGVLDSRSSLDLDLSFNAIFTSFKNTLKNQIFASTRYQTTFSHQTNDLNEKEYINAFTARVDRVFTNKIFKNETTLFFEFGYSFQLNPRLFLTRELGQNRNYQTRILQTLDIPLYWGKGRIEVVNPAWLATTILEFLKEESLLQTTTLSHEEITDFANRIAEIQQFRNTDFRLESIAEYEALVQYLIENNLIDPSKYKTFAIVQDAWRFESFITRRSGTELKYGIIAEYDTNSYSNSEEGFFNNLSNSLFGYSRVFGSIAYNSYKPVDTNWQMDFGNQIDIGLSIPIIYPEFFNQNSIFISRITLNQNIRYLPNQRTNFFLGSSLRYSFQRNLSENVSVPNFQNLVLLLQCSYDYYVSPKIAWSLRANFSFLGRYTDVSRYDNQNGIFASISYRPY